MNDKKIWLSLAQMTGNEMPFIQEAFDTNWVAPLGKNVNEFENSLQSFLYKDEVSSAKVVALNTGTAALHLGLLQLGVGVGDEVLCQTFTFAATANIISYLGAKPVFVDSETITWNMSPEFLEIAIKDRLAVSSKLPKAIIYVNLYGMPAQIDKLRAVADKYGIAMLEDAAESLGSEYKGKKCGTFGDFGVLSFNGNKIITTSGGGALICRDEEKAKKTLFYATQARENEVHYQHNEIGYNYRMSNISAGIGRGQLTALDSFVEARRRNHKLYKQLFKNIKGVSVQENPNSDFNSNFWLTCVLIDSKKFGKTTKEIRLMLEEQQIESRPLWKPMHLQPVFADAPFYGDGTAECLFENGLCLPSGVALTTDDINLIVDVMLSGYPPFNINEYARIKEERMRYRPMRTRKVKFTHRNFFKSNNPENI